MARPEQLINETDHDTIEAFFFQGATAVIKVRARLAVAYTDTTRLEIVAVFKLPHYVAALYLVPLSLFVVKILKLF